MCDTSEGRHIHSACKYLLGACWVPGAARGVKVVQINCPHPALLLVLNLKAGRIQPRKPSLLVVNTPQISSTQCNKNKTMAVLGGAHSVHKDMKAVWKRANCKSLSHVLLAESKDVLGKSSNRNVRETHPLEEKELGIHSSTRHVHFNVLEKK